MQTLRKTVDFYINSSLHVGFAIFCLVHITCLSTTCYEVGTYPVLVFFGTVVGYNFLKYFDWLHNKKWFRFNFIGIGLVSVVSSISFCILFWKQNATVQLYLALALGFVLLYPFIRKVGWSKLFFVSFVISYVTVFIPLAAEGKMEWGLFFQRFLMLCALIVPFEILDSKTDLVSLQTLPQLFGIEKTKWIGYCLLGIAFVLKVLASHGAVLLEGVFIYLLIAVAIYFSSLQRTKYYTLFWVESIPILWWLLLGLTKRQF